MNATRIVGHAEALLDRVAHRRNDTYYSWNMTTGERDFHPGIDYVADYRDNQLHVTIDDLDGERGTIFTTEGVEARRGAFVPRRPSPFAYRVNDWFVSPEPTERFETDMSPLRTYISATTPPWRVETRTDGRVVLGITDSTALQRAMGLENGSGYQYRFAPDSHVRIVVDATTGYPLRSERYLNYTELDPNPNGTYEVVDRRRQLITDD